MLMVLLCMASHLLQRAAQMVEEALAPENLPEAGAASASAPAALP